MKSKFPPSTYSQVPQVCRDGDDWHVIRDAYVGKRREVVRWTPIAVCPDEATANWICDAALARWEAEG